MMDRKLKPASLATRWERIQALCQSADAGGAARELTTLLERDPERREAWLALAELYAQRGLQPAANECLSNAHILSAPGSMPEAAAATPASATRSASLAHAYSLLLLGQAQQASGLLQAALAAGQANKLSAALAARAAWQAGQLGLAQSVCQSALYYWPACIQLHLILADCLAAQGDHGPAVEHTRLAHTFDPDGEVRRRWADQAALVQADQVTTEAGPSGVQKPAGRKSEPAGARAQAAATVLTRHVLGGDDDHRRKSEPATADPTFDRQASNDPQPEPETIAPQPDEAAGIESGTAHGLADDAIQAVRQTFDQLVRWLDPAPSAGDERTRPRRPKPGKPFHAIISARGPLARVCGSRASIIERAMTDLAGTITRYDGITAEALFVDDASSLASFGLEPVRSIDASSAKQLVDKLDDVLSLRGFQLTSLLIVGGDEIIPFHHLPNPTEDPDADVPTDTPYAFRACRSDDELVPDRLVGRMPHGMAEPGQASAVNMLLLQLGAALQIRVEQERAGIKSKNSLMRWLPSALLTSLPSVENWAGQAFGRKLDNKPVSSFGYAASVWRRAAQEVFSVVGPPQALRLSPPLGRPDMATLLAQTQPQLAYFNLHGLSDSPNWYGQRDPEFVADYAPFPVALSPADISKQVRVVFTAACYGAHLFGRDASTSIALRFMHSGTLALVGSTTVAYGGLGKPLIGADLLGQLFWQHIVSGLSSGEALRQAKIDFVNQLQRRQGYLDGEDQKTLSSFILLGDPLLAPLVACDPLAGYLGVQDSYSHLAIGVDQEQPVASHAPLLCARGMCRQARPDVPEEYLHQVQQFVSHTLPEMSNAAIQVSRPGACEHGCAGGPCSRSKAVSGQGNSPVQVSLAKTLPYGDRRGVQVVRITLDDGGKILKMAMSK